MSLLFIILDTLFKGVILVGVYLGGRYLIREALQGFPSLNDPNHQYADDTVRRQCRDFTCGRCHACESYTAYQHGELAKRGCDCDFPCYCEHYEQYK